MTRATVSPSSSSSSSSSSSASATETAAASTANPDRSRRAATQPEAAPLPKKLDAAPKLTAPKAAVKGKAAAPKKKGKAAATSEDSSTIALWLGKTQVCVASLLKIEIDVVLNHPVLRAAQAFEHKLWPIHDDAALDAFGNNDIRLLAKLFPGLIA